MNLMDLMEIGTLYGKDKFGIWEDIILDSRLSKQLLISEICRRCANSTPLSNTFGTFKQLTEAFFQKWQLQITKLVDSYYFDYNPIWNKDGKTVRNLTNDREKRRNTGDEYTENNDSTYSGTNEDTVSAYDSESYQPHNKTSENNNRHNTISSNRDIDDKETEGIIEGESIIEQGNIGVTTTQTMIKEEREIQDFNVYNWIVNKYESEVFLRVW